MHHRPFKLIAYNPFSGCPCPHTHRNPDCFEGFSNQSSIIPLPTDFGVLSSYFLFHPIPKAAYQSPKSKPPAPLVSPRFSCFRRPLPKLPTQPALRPAHSPHPRRASIHQPSPTQNRTHQTPSPPFSSRLQSSQQTQPTPYHPKATQTTASPTNQPTGVRSAAIRHS